jgi:hypothetical protein
MPDNETSIADVLAEARCKERRAPLNGSGDVLGVEGALTVAGDGVNMIT